MEPIETRQYYGPKERKLIIINQLSWIKVLRDNPGEYPLKDVIGKIREIKRSFLCSDRRDQLVFSDCCKEAITLLGIADTPMNRKLVADGLRYNLMVTLEHLENRNR